MGFYVMSDRVTTRVETALEIRLILTKPPSDISKLRVHEDHLVKIKQLKDSRLELPPDTLELQVTAFTHTALQTPSDREQAMKRALSKGLNVEENSGKSHNDASQSHDPDDYKPLEGSPVQICPGCAAREAKRLRRSKAKPEETDEWLEKASHCLLTFINTSPVLDWRSSNSTNAAELLSRQHSSLQNVEDKNKKKNNKEKKLPMPPVPPGTVAVDLQMRICCYCRHQHEQTGFE